MDRKLVLIVLLICCIACSRRMAVDSAPQSAISLNEGWVLSQVGSDFHYPANVPGCVQLDLVEHGKLDDPLVSDNELAALWVEEEDWIYTKRIKRDELPKGDSIEFVFESLDTYCQVKFNNNVVGESCNAFVPFRFRLGRADLQAQNLIEIQFYSTKKSAIKIAGERLLGRTAGNDSGDPKLSPYVRKPAFHFGWDWGPRILSTGITGDVSVSVFKPSYGESQKAEKNTSVQLIQESDSIGTSFQFLKNGKPLFIKGANYIPMSMYRSVPSDDDYRKLLIQVKESGMNMLRVWGGGQYEKDIFYELCDSLDILVWQDYMFAGAMYPKDEKFLEQVRQERAFQKERLSKYSNVVLWCGNNEVDVAWKNWGWLDLLEQDSVALQRQYDLLFKETLAGEGYIHSSPLSNWGKEENFNHHNMHYWGVWHGPDNFDGFEKYVPRFMSEYGFQSFPMPGTFAGQVSESRWHIDSEAMQHRQKSYKENKELIRHLVQHYPFSEDFREFCYLSQLNQALAMGMAINAQRSSNGHCAGTLYWQLNDVWAGPTWSTIDFKGNWKLAHYTVQDLYKPQIVIAKKNKDGIAIHIANDVDESKTFQLDCKLITFDGTIHWQYEKQVRSDALSDHHLIQLNYSEIGLDQVDSKNCFLEVILKDDQNEVDELKHYFHEPKELLLPSLKEGDIKIVAKGKNKYYIEVKRFVKDLFLYFPTSENQRFSENGFDLLPGEGKIVYYLGERSDEEIRFLYLNNLVFGQNR